MKRNSILMVLLVTTALSIYKPWGKTGYAFGGEMSLASTSGTAAGTSYDATRRIGASNE